MALQIRGSSQIKNASISLTKLDTQGGTIAGNVTLSGDTITVNNTLTTKGSTTLGDSTSDTTTCSGTLNANAIENTPIGASTPSTGAFTTISSSGASTLNSLTVTNNTSVGGNLTVDGNLTVSGDTVQMDVSNLKVEDSLIYIATSNSSSDAIDIGFVGLYNDGSDKYAGLVRDSTDDKFKLFNTTQDLSSATTVNFNTATIGTLLANIEGNVTGNLTGNVTGNSSTASTLQTSRTISLGSDLSGSVSFDGSGDVILNATIVNNSIQYDDIDFLVDEDTMSSDSAVKVPTQQSVKSYVDSQISSGGLTGQSVGDIQMYDGTNFVAVKFQDIFITIDDTNSLHDTLNNYIDLSSEDAEINTTFQELSEVYLNGQKLRYSDDNLSTNDFHFITDGSSIKRIKFASNIISNGDELEVKYYTISSN